LDSTVNEDRDRSFFAFGKLKVAVDLGRCFSTTSIACLYVDIIGHCLNTDAPAAKCISDETDTLMQMP